MINTLNRSTQPALQIPQSIPIKTPQKFNLSNGIPVYLFNMGQQEIVMIKLVFNAGKWQEPQKLVARLTNRMLKEGTQKRSAQNLAETIEYYGANLRTESQRNHAEVTLYTLNKHLNKLLPIVKEILTEATFPAEELANIATNNQQKLLVSLQKNDVIAGRLYKEKIYGKTHPYGYTLVPELYQNINRQQLQQFYQTHYTANNCTLYIAGKINDEQLKSVEQHLGTNDWVSEHQISEQQHPTHTYTPETIHLKGPQSAQASIIIGRPMFNRTHPDYIPMQITNTLLGGFFGSRLMRNIREDKGYTYGVYASLSSLLNGGHFYISTDVKTEVREAALKEIFWEIERLKNDPVEKEELDLVKNYIIGTMLAQLDGTFSLAGSLQGVYMYGLDEQFYHQAIQTIRKMEAQEIQEMAQKYLQKNDLTQIVVGGII